MSEDYELSFVEKYREKITSKRIDIIKKKADKIYYASIEFDKQFLEEIQSGLLSEDLSKRREICALTRKIEYLLDEINSCCPKEGFMGIVKVKELEDLVNLKDRILKEVISKAIELKYPYVQLSSKDVYVYIRLFNRKPWNIHAEYLELVKDDGRYIYLPINEDIIAYGIFEKKLRLELGSYRLKIHYVNAGRLTSEEANMVLLQRGLEKWVSIIEEPVTLEGLRKREGEPIESVILEGKKGKYLCDKLLSPKPSELGSGVKYAILRCENLILKIPVQFLQFHFKSVTVEAEASEKARKSFEEEVRIFEERIEEIGHPHILRFLDYCEEKLATVWEYCPYGSLAEISRETFIPVEETLKIGIQVADALTKLYEFFESPHCDIKPQNMLVDSNKIVKLADFESMAVVRTGAGVRRTPLYRAPENSVSIKGDVYGLALTLAELIISYHPSEDSGRDLVRELRFHRDLSKSIKKVLLEALKENPEERPDMKSFAESLWKCLQEMKTVK